MTDYVSLGLYWIGSEGSGPLTFNAFATGLRHYAATRGRPTNESSVDRGAKGGRWLGLLGLFLLIAALGGWAVIQRGERTNGDGPIFPGIASAVEGNLAKKGEYIFRAAGCAACHTAADGALLAGERAFATPRWQIRAGDPLSRA